jgi:hypothetical protein
MQFEESTCPAESYASVQLYRYIRADILHVSVGRKPRRIAHKPTGMTTENLGDVIGWGAWRTGVSVISGRRSTKTALKSQPIAL